MDTFRNVLNKLIKIKDEIDIHLKIHSEGVSLHIPRTILDTLGKKKM